MTSDVPQHGDLDDHHIVPASWGKKNGKSTLIHTILNRTPLTADTNRKVIGDRLPNQYLPELIQENGETTVRGILESHLISPQAQEILLRDPFNEEDFEQFISERQKTIQGAIEDLLIKERLDLSPQLRELDEKIEIIELALRICVEQTMTAADCELPSHVMQKVLERITRSAKKDASFDSEFYDTLKGKLEFFDLREIQDTITNKALWVSFEARFKNKDKLASKFGQLAELRNGIRHSRTTDEVTKKEGEAAILWFTKVLEV